jgi:hypothetical protein
MTESIRINEAILKLIQVLGDAGYEVKIIRREEPLPQSALVYQLEGLKTWPLNP